MGDDLNFWKMEVDLNNMENGRLPHLFENGRLPYLFGNWKTTSIFWKKEGDLIKNNLNKTIKSKNINIFINGRLT